MQALQTLWKASSRTLAVIAIVAILSYIAVECASIYKQAKQHQDQQLNNVTNLLLSQTIATATPFIIENKMHELAAYATQVAAEPYVKRIRFYNIDGHLLLGNDNAVPTSSEITFKTPFDTESIRFKSLVRPLINENQVIGFIDITFEPQSTNGWSDLQYTNKLFRIYWFVLLAFGCGIVFTLSFINPWRKMKKRDLLQVKNKSPKNK